jgi:hypothetical protein
LDLLIQRGHSRPPGEISLSRKFGLRGTSVPEQPTA